MLVKLYEYTTLTLTRLMEKKCGLKKNAAFNSSEKQHTGKQELYGYLPSILQNI